MKHYGKFSMLSMDIFIVVLQLYNYSYQGRHNYTGSHALALAITYQKFARLVRSFCVLALGLEQDSNVSLFYLPLDLLELD